jgi:ubiquitin
VTFRRRQPLTPDVNDDLVLRLREAGRRPVDPAVRAEHMHRISAELQTVARHTAPTPRRRSRVVPVTAAAIAGFFAGSTGLAFAGALPAPAQNVFHDVLDDVVGPIGLEVPEKNRGQCVADAAKIDDKDDKRDAKGECPKGGVGNDGDDNRNDGSSSDTSGSDEVDSTSPGRSGEAPGRTKDSTVPGSVTATSAPGRSGDAPGQAPDDTTPPGRSGAAPGQNPDVTTPPGRGGDAPGQAPDDTTPPGRSGAAPGQDTTTTATAGPPPSSPGNANGQGNGNGQANGNAPTG